MGIYLNKCKTNISYLFFPLINNMIISSAICLCWITPSQGEEYLVHSPQMSLPAYRQYLTKHGKDSFVAAISKKKSLIDLNSLSLSGHVDDLQKSINFIERTPLRETEYESLVFLYEKKNEKQTLPFGEKIRYIGLLSLSEEIFFKNQEKTQKAISTLPPILQKTPLWMPSYELAFLKNYILSPDSLVLVDGVPVRSPEQKISSYPHQWVYISNSAKPVIIVGSIKEFENALTKLQLFGEEEESPIIPWPTTPTLTLKNIGSGPPMLTGPFFPSTETATPKLNRMLWVVPLMAAGGSLMYSYFQKKHKTSRPPGFDF